MANYIDNISHTFGEYLLLPGYSSKKHLVSNVNLETSLVKYKKGSKSKIILKTPMVSAIMQSVSNDTLAIELAKNGGLSFIYCSQSIADQCEMVNKVKRYKAGFVISDSNIKGNATLFDLLKLIDSTGHSTVAITDNGLANGKLLGLITSRDYRLSRVDLNSLVEDYMTPIDQLVTGHVSLDLSQCNDIIWDKKLNTLPIVDDFGHLVYLVFRKDYDSFKIHPLQLLDQYKRYMVGAGINTKDYKERVPALLKVGVDVLCIDSSEGHSEWQKDTIKWIKDKYNDQIYVGAGNVVDKDGFKFLADCGADFIKVGIGGGSICITRETKGIGRGQASALIEVVQARDEYYKKHGVYIPICSDGGIVYDYHLTLALAMGADFVMLGRYFARFEEAPNNKIMLNGSYFKEYWGEGSNRAKNWQRYDIDSKELFFEEGVDSYIPYAGLLSDGIKETVYKIKSTMCNCGSLDLLDFHKNAKLTLVSSTSIVEGKAHDVIVKDNTTLKDK